MQIGAQIKTHTHIITTQSSFTEYTANYQNDFSETNENKLKFYIAAVSM